MNSEQHLEHWFALVLRMSEKSTSRELREKQHNFRVLVYVCGLLLKQSRCSEKQQHQQKVCTYPCVQHLSLLPRSRASRSAAHRQVPPEWPYAAGSTTAVVQKNIKAFKTCVTTFQLNLPCGCQVFITYKWLQWWIFPQNHYTSIPNEHHSRKLAEAFYCCHYVDMFP